jgi:hypothetical protein
MPIRVAIPRLKNNSIKRQNGNLTSAWVTIQPVGPQNLVRTSINDNNTLETVFDENELLRAQTVGSADQIRIANPINNSLTGYFFNTGSATVPINKWRLALNRLGPDQNNTVIPNNAVIQILRVGTAGLKTINLKGTARIATYQ